MKNKATPYVIAIGGILAAAGVADSDTLRMVLISIAAVLAVLLFRRCFVDSPGNG